MKCMQTNFGGHGLSSFGDFASFCLPSKMAKISLQTMNYSPWGSENGIGSKYACIFMQAEVHVKMYVH